MEMMLNGWIEISDTKSKRGRRDYPALNAQSPRELVELLENSPEQVFTTILERLLSDNMETAWERLREAGVVDSRYSENNPMPFVQTKTPTAIFYRILQIQQHWESAPVELHRKINENIPYILECAKNLSTKIRELDLDFPEQFIANCARLNVGKQERGAFNLDPKDRANQIEQFPQTSFADLLDAYQRLLDPGIKREDDEQRIELRTPVVPSKNAGDRHFYRLFADFLNAEFQIQPTSVIAAFGSAVFGKDVDDRTVLDALSTRS